MTRSIAVVAALLALLVTGCGGGSDSSAGPTSGTSTPAATTPTSAAPTDLAVPAGYRRVTAPKAQLSFAIPSAWTLTDAAMFDSPKLRPALAKLAASQHLTLDQLKEKVSRVEFLASGVPASSGGTVSGGEVAGYTDLPTADRVKAAFEALNASVDAVKDVQTPVGDGRLVTFHEPVPAGTVLYGQVLYVRGPNGVADFSIARDTAARAADQMTVLTSSLRLAG